MIDVLAGRLFLGGQLHVGAPKRNRGPLLIEAADLTTRRVGAGMIGSGTRVIARSAMLIPVG